MAELPQRLGGRLERVLFEPVSAAMAGAFRIAFALLLVPTFWPRSVVLADVHWLGLAVAWLLFLAGVGSRAAGFFLAVLLFPLAFDPGLGVSRQILLFSLLSFSFVRSDQAFSLRRGAAGSQAGPAWPIRLIQMQLVAVYGANAIAKSTPAFLGGDTLMALSLLPNFRVDLTSGFLEVGSFLVAVPVLAVGVTAAEYLLAGGWLIARLRPAVAAFGLAFHFVLAQVVQIGLLNVACVFLYTSFLVPFIETGDTRPPSSGGDPSGVGDHV